MTQNGLEIGDDAVGSVGSGFNAAGLASTPFYLSLLTAAVIGACLVLSHWSTSRPLPVFWGATVFVVIVAQQDAYRRKIPNWLTGTGLLLALATNFGLTGVSGLLTGLAGAGLCFALLLGPYVVRVLGAGDVKAFMALGGLWGVSLTLNLIVWSFLVGGAMAVVVLAARGELPSFARRWGKMIKLTLASRRIQYYPPGSDEAAAGGLPFGIAIGLAVAAQQLWGAPWR
jgi:prepilin peptidase CpaA